MSGYKYFKGINTNTTLEEIKSQYRKLAIANHPDNGGSTETMAQINSEFSDLCHKYGHQHKAADGTVYEKQTEERPSDFIEIIDHLIRLGLDFDIVGSFVWIYGNTYANKEAIKAMGAKWSGRKKMWYIAPKDWHPRRKGMSYEEIKDVFGVAYEHRAEEYQGIAVA